MVDILSVGGEPVFDERIVRIETHTYNPYANTTLGHSDEIRIPIQQQDLYTLPSESFLYVEGELLDDSEKSTTTTTTAATGEKTKETTTSSDASAVRMTLVNNCVAFMFDEIRYELDGVEIDRNRNVGTTSTLKNYATLSTLRVKALQNAGWETTDSLFFRGGRFNFCVPLNLLLGFCEDYKRIVINARHELVLIRARNDKGCILANEHAKNPRVNLFKVQWRMPHVILNDVNKLSLLRTLESGRYLKVSFRSWDLYEFPLLQKTNKHSWAVKVATQMEKPRYVVFAMQTGRRNSARSDSSRFDHCELTNIKLYLNSEFYPYDDMNLDFASRRYAVLYDMYARFRRAYYGVENDETILTRSEFLTTGPFAVIDCSHQNESVKSSTVDVRLEFECKQNVPSETTAYCLVIHDRVIEYSPLTNVVRRVV